MGATLLSFAAVCLAIELTPGPNMAYLAILSATRGRSAGFWATSGVALGLLLVGILAASGLSATIAASPTLYDLLRWIGMFYLLWLAWEAWRGDTETSPADARSGTSVGQYFRRGLITNLLNPKAAAFYITILPSFVDASQAVLPQAIILSIVYVSIATLIHCAIVLLASAARPWLEDPTRQQIVRRVMAVALAAIALWFLYSSAR